ncbi:MAG: response regulator [Gloeomargaritaceae cyanobacterium C42_A2020_066]|nr:response regulator [Gloeomargaritaceae cyanobacterium C42_A2020_066]
MTSSQAVGVLSDPTLTMTILVVDDSLMVRELITQYLEEGGNYIVDTADGGEAGWQKICASPPDMVISDWSMPSVSGIDLCRRVKSDPHLQHIYFLMLTAREAVDDRVMGLDTGADEFISKPINPKELQARVRAGLRLRYLTQSLLAANQQLRVQNELLASLSLTDLLTGVLSPQALEAALPNLLLQVGERPAVPSELEPGLSYRYLSLWVVVLDNLPEIQAAHGNSIAEQVLKIVARRLQSHALPGSHLYRSGEAGFVCVTPGISPERAQALGDSLRQGVVDYPITLGSEFQVEAAVSVGGTLATPDHKPHWQTLMQEAWEAATQARTAGRNQVVQHR